MSMLVGYLSKVQGSFYAYSRAIGIVITVQIMNSHLGHDSKYGGNWNRLYAVANLPPTL